MKENMPGTRSRSRSAAVIGLCLVGLASAAVARDIIVNKYAETLQEYAGPLVEHFMPDDTGAQVNNDPSSIPNVWSAEILRASLNPGITDCNSPRALKNSNAKIINCDDTVSIYVKAIEKNSKNPAISNVFSGTLIMDKEEYVDAANRINEDDYVVNAKALHLNLKHCSPTDYCKDDQNTQFTYDESGEWRMNITVVDNDLRTEDGAPTFLESPFTADSLTRLTQELS